MKKLFRTLLCGAVLALSMSVSAFASENDVLISPTSAALPEKQGDFYVLINDEYVTFTDAVPQIKNDRSCLPFVAVFEQLGFAEKDMTWDGATRTVTATKPDVPYIPFGGGDPRRGDVTVQLTIGSNTFYVQYEGETTTAPMAGTVQVVRDFTSEAAPYIDPATNRTYVPFGLVADALGYSVGWDAQQGTVIIDDVDAILTANEATYTLMDKYLAYSKSFCENNQKVTGSYAADLGMDLNAKDSSLEMDFAVDGKYGMVTSGATALQFDTDMTMDMSMLMDGQDMTQAMNGAEGAPQFPLNIDMELRGNMTDSVFYYQSAALAQMMGQPDLNNAWFKLDMTALFDQMSDILGIDYTALVNLPTGSLNASFEETLVSMLKAMPLTSAEMTTSDYLSMINAVCADSSFKRSGTNYVNTTERDGRSITFTLYTNGSKVTGYEIDLTVLAPEQNTMMELAATMKDKKLQMGMNMEMPMEDMGTLAMTMTMDGTYQSTSTKPVTAPPSGAAIINLNQMLPAME